MASMVEVSVESIRVSLINQSRLVVLREKHGPRYLSIWIGSFEADAITVGLQEAQVSRPLTHDLLGNLARDLGARIECVRILSLKEDTYFAELVMDQGGVERQVDARPSDAIAVAVRQKVPVFVSEEVMEAAGQVPAPEYDGPAARPAAASSSPAEPTDKLDVFRHFVDTLDLSDLGNSSSS